MTARAALFELAPPEDRHRGRIALIVALSTTNVGDGIAAVALPLLVIEQTRSPTVISFVSAAALLPRIVGQLPAGVLLTRFGHRRMFVVATTTQFIVFAAATALSLSGPLDYAFILASAFVISLAGVIYDLAALSVIPSLVVPKDLRQFTATLVIAESLSSSLIGAPLGSIAVAASISGALGTTTLLYLATSIMFVRLFYIQPRTLVAAPAAWHRQHTVVDSWNWLVRQPQLASLIALDAIIAVAAAANTALLVLLAREQLDVGPAAYGLLTGGIAVGSTFAAVCIRHKGLSERTLLKQSTQLRVSSSALGAALIALGFLTSAIVAGILFVIVGASLAAWQTTTTSAELCLLPADARPRLIALSTTIVTTAALGGAVAAGILAQATSVSTCYLASGLLCIFAASIVTSRTNALPEAYEPRAAAVPPPPID